MEHKVADHAGDSHEYSDWRRGVREININGIHKSRTCKVVLLAESTMSISHVVKQFYCGSKLYPSQNIKFLNHIGVMEMIRNCWLHYKESSSCSPVFLMLNSAASEVQELQKGKTIPCELIAYLIKLNIILLINEDVVLEQKKLLKNAELENMNWWLPISKVNETRSTKNKNKTGKAKTANNKKNKKTNKETKKNATENPYDICNTDVLIQPRASSKLRNSTNMVNMLPDDNIEIEECKLFFAAVGFYNPNLIKELIKIGVPIECVVEVCLPNSTETLAPKCHSLSLLLDNQVDFGMETMNYLFLMDSQRADELKNCAVVNFWKQINELFEGDIQHKYLENTFHIRLFAFDDVAADRNTADYIIQSIHLFILLGEFLVNLVDNERQHMHYCQQLNICGLGRKLNELTVNQMKMYTKHLEDVPPECCNVSVILHSLVKEVCYRSSELKKSDTVTKHASPKSKTSLNTPFHGSIKNQTIRFLLNYESNYNSENVLHKSRNMQQPEDNLHTKPIFVHEDNFLEILINPYKKLALQLFDPILTYLDKGPSIFLWKMYPPLKQSQEYINSVLFELWSTAYNLEKNEILIAINFLLLNQLKISQVKYGDGRILNNLSDMITQFPHKTEKDVLAERETRILEYLDTFDVHGSIHEETRHINSYLSDTFCGYAEVNAYKQWETLSKRVLLQKLNNEFDNYLCVDHTYSCITDSLLLRFHNNLDSFGLHTKVWVNTLRTPVCIRDFCKYTMDDERYWITSEENQFQQNLREHLVQAELQYKDVRKEVYTALDLSYLDYVQIHSLKNLLLKREEENVENLNKKQKRTGKQNKKENVKTKTSIKPSKKNQKNATGTIKENKTITSKIRYYEQISRPIIFNRYDILNLTKLYNKERSNLIAYDLSNKYVQLTSSSTIFQSLDGVDVRVDRSLFLGTQKNLVTINTKIRHNSLIFHYYPNIFQESLLFHFSICDGSIISFSKPEKQREPVNIICDAIKDVCEKRGKPIFNMAKKQALYFVSEKLNYVRKKFDIPYITRRNLVLTESSLKSFLKRLRKRNIPTSVIHTHNAQNSSDQHCKSHNQMNYKPKFGPRYIAQLEDSVSHGVSSSNDIAPSHSDVIKKHEPKFKLSRSDLNNLPPATKKETLQKIKLLQVPVYKICSSILHRYEYVKRVKSYVAVPVENMIKRMACQRRYCKTKRKVEVSKCYPLHTRSTSNITRLYYDLRLSLPSGLIIKNVHENERVPFHIKQFYIQKSPQLSTRVADEASRIFTRDGSVIINLSGGKKDVLKSNGTIVHCKFPCFFGTNNVVLKTSKKRKMCHNSNMPLHTQALHDRSIFKKQLQVVLRWQKHLIDGPESLYLQSRRAYKCVDKKNSNVAKLYFMQSEKSPFYRYSLITNDGHKVIVAKSKIGKKKLYYCSVTPENLHEEIFYEREDKTHGVFNRDGKLVMQFPDNTRITTWYDECPNLVFFNKKNTHNTNWHDEPQQTESGNASKVHETKVDVQSSLNNGIDDDGWVLINLNCKYEHPNYATVTYYGADKSTKLILPNSISLMVTKEGHYTIDINDEIHGKITDEKIELQTALCSSCHDKCVTVLNIQPIFNNNYSTNTKELYRITDSYNKVFVVDFQGNCFRNSTYVRDNVNKIGCKTHASNDFQKVYVLFRNLSGMQFWDTQTFKDRISKGKKCPDTEILFGSSNEPDELNNVEIIQRVCQPYYTRFSTVYQYPHLHLTKNKPEKISVNKKLAYTLHRIINQISNVEKLQPLFSLLIDQIDKEQELVEFIHRSSNCSGNINTTNLEMNKISDKCQPNLKTNRITRPERISKWKTECLHYKQKIRQKCTESYFSSKLYQPFTTSNGDSIGKLMPNDICQISNDRNCHTSNSEVENYYPSRLPNHTENTTIIYEDTLDKTVSKSAEFKIEDNNNNYCSTYRNASTSTSNCVNDMFNAIAFSNTALIYLHKKDIACGSNFIDVYQYYNGTRHIKTEQRVSEPEQYSKYTYASRNRTGSNREKNPIFDQNENQSVTSKETLEFRQLFFNKQSLAQKHPSQLDIKLEKEISSQNCRKCCYNMFKAVKDPNVLESHNNSILCYRAPHKASKNYDIKISNSIDNTSSLTIGLDFHATGVDASMFGLCSAYSINEIDHTHNTQYDVQNITLKENVEETNSSNTKGKQCAESEFDYPGKIDKRCSPKLLQAPNTTDNIDYCTNCLQRGQVTYEATGRKINAPQTVLHYFDKAKNFYTTAHPDQYIGRDKINICNKDSYMSKRAVRHGREDKIKCPKDITKVSEGTQSQQGRYDHVSQCN